MIIIIIKIFSFFSFLLNFSKKLSWGWTKMIKSFHRSKASRFLGHATWTWIQMRKNYLTKLIIRIRILRISLQSLISMMHRKNSYIKSLVVRSLRGWLKFLLTLRTLEYVKWKKLNWETLNTQIVKIIFSSRGEFEWLNDFGSRIRVKCHTKITRLEFTSEGEKCQNWENIDSLGVQLVPMTPPPLYDPYANFYDPHANLYDPFIPSPEPSFFFKNYYDPLQMTCYDFSKDFVHMMKSPLRNGMVSTSY